MTSGREAYRKTTQGDVVLFSSCMDNQTAADSKVRGQRGGERGEGVRWSERG